MFVNNPPDTLTVAYPSEALYENCSESLRGQSHNRVPFNPDLSVGSGMIFPSILRTPTLDGPSLVLESTHTIDKT